MLDEQVIRDRLADIGVAIAEKQEALFRAPQGYTVLLQQLSIELALLRAVENTLLFVLEEPHHPPAEMSAAAFRAAVEQRLDEGHGMHEGGGYVIEGWPGA